MMLTHKSLLVGESQPFLHLTHTISRVSQNDSTVLITGESGTGKELVARAIHAASSRSNGPFVIVNCGAIPGELLEAELFGHVRGAFTGATQNRIGRFELAHGGTIFLDEIGDLPFHLQVKLLRVLQVRQFEPVGSSHTKDVDVRIIAATNVDLEEAVQRKSFREDLFYRLNVLPVRVPALRERIDDIPVLLNHFIQKFNQLTGHSVQPPIGKVLEALRIYQWPGNIRELENLIERLVIMKNNGEIEMEDLPNRIFREYANEKSQGTGAISEWDFPKMVLPTSGVNLKAIVSAFENHLIDQALARTQGNKNKASELLKMNRTTLVEKLRKRGMIKPAKGRVDTSTSAAGATAGSIVNPTLDTSSMNADSSTQKIDS